MKRLGINVNRGYRKVRWMRVLPLVALSLLTAVTSAGTKKEVENSAASSARAKSRHFYLQGVQAAAMERGDEAYEFFRRAYESDSTNPEAALEYAYYHRVAVMGADGDTTGFKRALKNAGGVAELYPGDFFTIYDYVGLVESTGNHSEAIRVMEKFMDLNPGHTSGLEALTDLYLDNNEIDKSLATLEKYERIEGADVKTTIRKAGIHLAVKDTASAIAEAAKLVEKHPGEPEYLVLKAQIESYVGKDSAAFETLRKAEEMSEPGQGGPAKVQMAEIYRQRGDSAQYDLKVYEALMSDDLPYEAKHDLLAYYLSNQLKENQGNSRGDKLFETLLRQYPHEPSLQNLAARYSAAKKDYPSALEQICYAIDLDPVNEEYRVDALRFAYFAKDYAAMDSIYASAKIHLSPLNPETMVLYAQLLSSTERYADALKVFDELAAREFPGIVLTEPLKISSLDKNIDVNHLNLLITLYQDVGDTYNLLDSKDMKNTFVCYDNVLQLAPDNPLTLNNYAYFLTRDQDNELTEEELERALKMSEEATRLDPENPTYLDTRAWVLFRAARYDEAKEIMEGALEIINQDMAAHPEEEEDESYKEYYDHYGDILNALGDKDGAKEYWRKALRLDPENNKIKLKLRK